jgi:hypothetical protein
MRTVTARQYFDKLPPPAIGDKHGPRGFMGCERVEVPESIQLAMKTALLAWASPNGSVTLRPAKAESAGKAHDRNAPGLNHVAFNAENREEVERLYNLQREIDGAILDPPAVSLHSRILCSLLRRSGRSQIGIRLLAPILSYQEKNCRLKRART